MRNFATHKRGQFVIIAALLVALMMISISPLLHEAATYYTHEPWEEYLSLIGGLELNSQRLMELSLISFTQTGNEECLNNNLREWQTELSHIYPGKAIFLDFDSGSGLSYSWHHPSSYSRAFKQFYLGISSIGLSGYQYEETILLNLTILPTPSTNQINVTVTKENGLPVTALNENNFLLSNSTNIDISSVNTVYDPEYSLVYIINCEEFSGPIDVTVVDDRSLLVTATYP